MPHLMETTTPCGPIGYIGNYREPSTGSIRLRDRRNEKTMNLVLLIVAAVLTQVAFITLVRKVHDRSIHQAFGRWFGR